MNKNELGYWYDISKDRFFCKDKNKVVNLIKSPLTACVHVGYKCNLMCFYCSSKHNLRNEKDAFLCDPIADFIKAHNIKRIVISGGEPFLYPDRLQTFLQLLKKEDVATLISTNGTVIENCTDEILELVDWIDVSLPATTKALYEQIRGVDLFDEVIDFIRKMVYKNKRVRVSYTLNSLNKDDVSNILPLIDELEVANIRIGYTYSEDGNYLSYNSDIFPMLWEMFQKEFKKKNITIYLPMTKKKVHAYQKGYMVIRNDGNIYRFNTLPSNRLFSVYDFTKNDLSLLQDISYYQAELFLTQL